METQIAAVETGTKKVIDLMNGQFTVNEASDILNGVLDVKINFHKIQVLSRTEGNENDKCEYDHTRLDKLVSEKQLTKDFLNELRGSGKKLRITSVIQVVVED